jgi:hypothetical protein
MVVEQPKFKERNIERIGVGKRQGLEQRFERAEQPFDAAVLPWRVGLCELLADAQVLKHDAQQAALEDGFVVGPDGLGFAMLADGKAEMAEHGPGVALRDAFEAQQQA